MDKIKNFRDLKIWLLGIDIAREVYDFTKKIPKEELFGLTSQMKRSAISIPSNIAEGFNRFHNKEYRQFLFLTLGSVAELETQCELASDFGLINETQKASLLEKLDHETGMLRNLIKKL